MNLKKIRRRKTKKSGTGFQGKGCDCPLVVHGQSGQDCAWPLPVGEDSSFLSSPGWGPKGRGSLPATQREDAIHQGISLELS